jgi:propionyl-CoA carboxylase alpha chain
LFNKILIANRGEIACRIIKTAQVMGIKTVAVYSKADEAALHVRMADEAVYIGPATSAESYLAIDKILNAVQITGAEAVHPGYGFLSENKTFPRELSREGVTFIGPRPGAIEAMGDKIESKKLAIKAGVNTIPGHLEAIDDPHVAIAIANDIGYPVMLKASAGGGGKGMRLVRNDDECRDGLIVTMNEGRKYFNDARVFIEKFIQQPRHIEIQLIADNHDNVISLGERECSIQRRHQKVIEEAPSPFLDENLRQAMERQAIALARDVNYNSAGTVEFIVDSARNFYFLEMNTRLQVEHPVTEMITGLDLVELMIRVAANEELPINQDEVKRQGWALEARLYAEDPENNFAPSTGRLLNYRPPEEGGATVRIDSGVVEGSEISMFYDPMIAKLVTHGHDREEAINNMRKVLDHFYIRGVKHNLLFLNHLIRHPRFNAGQMTTDFISEEFPKGLTEEQLQPQSPQLLAAVAVFIHDRKLESEQPVVEQQLKQEYVAFLGDTKQAGLNVSIVRRDDAAQFKIGEWDMVIESAWRPGDLLFHGKFNHEVLSVQIDMDENDLILSHNGCRARILVVEKRIAPLMQFMPRRQAQDDSNYMISPMAGLLVSLTVQPGDFVKAGKEIAVVEAMKMENMLHASRDMTIKDVYAVTGDKLRVKQKILKFL